MTNRTKSTVSLADIRKLIPEKVYSVLLSGHKKDFYDLHEIWVTGSPIEELLELHGRRHRWSPKEEEVLRS